MWIHSLRVASARHLHGYLEVPWCTEYTPSNPKILALEQLFQVCGVLGKEGGEALFAAFRFQDGDKRLRGKSILEMVNGVSARSCRSLTKALEEGLRSAANVSILVGTKTSGIKVLVEHQFMEVRYFALRFELPYPQTFFS
jgi:hypothetical protein